MKSNRMVTSIPRGLASAWIRSIWWLLPSTSAIQVRAWVGVAAVGFVEDAADDGGGVVGDAGGQPLVRRDRGLGRLLGVGVGRRPRRGRGCRRGCARPGRRRRRRRPRPGVCGCVSRPWTAAWTASWWPRLRLSALPTSDQGRVPGGSGLPRSNPGPAEGVVRIGRPSVRPTGRSGKPPAGYRPIHRRRACDRRPAVIVCCASPADVAAGITFAQTIGPSEWVVGATTPMLPADYGVLIGGALSAPEAPFVPPIRVTVASQCSPWPVSSSSPGAT